MLVRKTLLEKSFKKSMPILILAISSVYLLPQILYFQVLSYIDYFSMLADAVIVLIIFTLINFIFRKKWENNKCYVFLFGGFFLLYFSFLTKMVDDIFVHPKMLTYIFDGFFQVIAFGLIGIGVSKWTKHNENILNELNQLASYDKLTGLLNRRSFEGRAEVALSNSKRYKHALTIIMLDIDYFKSINDTCGHSSGDMVLQMFSYEVSSILRVGDIICRWGGDEFVILLPNTKKDAALLVAGKIRAKVEHLELIVSGEKIKFTVSAGVSCLMREDENIATLINRADQILYNAKKSNRNIGRG